MEIVSAKKRECERDENENVKKNHAVSTARATTIEIL